MSIGNRQLRPSKTPGKGWPNARSRKGQPSILVLATGTSLTRLGLMETKGLAWLLGWSELDQYRGHFDLPTPENFIFYLGTATSSSPHSSGGYGYGVGAAITLGVGLSRFLKEESQYTGCLSPAPRSRIHC